MGFLNANFAKISVSEPSALGLRCLKRSHPCFPVAPQRPPRPLVSSPVEFTHEYLYPSPGARDTVSFGLDDILLTAASDSEDFGPALAGMDMESVWQSGSGPLCFSRVIPMPALILPKFPDDSGHRCIRPSVAECQSVRVSANKADFRQSYAE